MMNIRVAISETHKNAVNHGWWESERPVSEIYVLFHCELSEAIEAERNRERMYWIDENGKPEGAAVELIDCVIRILDYVGSKDKDVQDIFTEHYIQKVGANGKTKVISYTVALMHNWISRAWVHGEKKRHEKEMKLLADVVAMIYFWIGERGINPYEVLKRKHEYNKNRPHKHGKKF